MRWGIILAMLMLVTSIPSFGLGIGAAPGTINFGEVYRGKKYLGESYILTTADSKIVVSLRYADPHMAWELHPGARTDFNISQSSEEDISKWINFPQNPVLIDPAYKTYIRLPTGESIAANKKIGFYINIPKDAEPGYHMGSISIDPQLSSSLGTGVSTIGVSRIVFTFKVPGEVRREFDIIGIEARRISDKDVDFDVLVKNKGTVTASFHITELKLFDNQGNIVTVLSSGWTRLRPGETGIVTLHWHSNKPVETTYYTAKAKLSWYYGESSISEDVKIPEKIEIKRKEPKKCTGFPFWFAIATALLVMGAVYLTDGMPILVTIGLLGLSAYKLLTCDSLAIWPLLLIALAYLYEKVGSR